MMIRAALIGANGQLSTDLQKTFNPKKWSVIPLLHKDIEITDPQSIELCLNPLAIDMIINTAAFHRVDLCENQAHDAFAVNALGVRNLALWCAKNNKILVHFSTDYVFGLDKSRNVAYSESDCVGPINVYGASKAAGEFFVQSILEKYFLIRTTGLFGSAGSSVKRGNFVEAIIAKAKNGEELKVVKDQVLSPTYTKNLSQNLELLLQTNHYGLYHMVSHGECSWYEFAKEIITLMDMKSRITALSSDQSSYLAKRPHYSALANENLIKIDMDTMNSWQENLRMYLGEKGYII